MIYFTFPGTAIHLWKPVSQKKLPHQRHFEVPDLLTAVVLRPFQNRVQIFFVTKNGHRCRRLRVLVNAPIQITGEPHCFV
jgi:hypothetical protein